MKIKTTSRIYAAYGSNMNVEQMSYRCPTAVRIGVGLLRNYKLMFRAGHRMAVATVEHCSGSNVPVVLWQIQPQDEAALDRYEGAPHFYRQEQMTVWVEDNGALSPVHAMVYVMNDGYQIGAPSKLYFNIIKQGYIDNDINTSTLAAAARKCALIGSGKCDADDV